MGEIGEISRIRRVRQETKAELQARLAAALARAEAAERAQQTAPGDGGIPAGMLAPAKGVMRVWIMTDDEGYQLSLLHIDKEGCGWRLRKWSDGTVYELHEPTGGTMECTCPGYTKYGPQCADGRGCKHLRAMRALRQLVDPGI